MTQNAEDQRLLERIKEAGYTPDTISRSKLGKCMGMPQGTKLQKLYRYVKDTYATGKPKFDPIPQIEEHRLKRENRDLRQKLQEALDGRERDEAYEHFIGEVAKHRVNPPAWTYNKRKSKGHRATAMGIFSDWHLDEVIDPAQVNYVNAYDRDIALQRLKTYTNNFIELSSEYITGLDYDGLVLAFAGDNQSGDIHEELTLTNEGTMIESVLFWLDPVAAMLKLFADHFGRVHVPAVVGNHSRRTHKPISKGRVRDSFDWLFCKLLERELRADSRITFDVSESADCMFKVLNTNFLLTHGDQFKGGSGIAGLLSPMMIGDARKRKRQQAVNQPYDYMIMGHWHQLTSARGVIINGSGKGFDEYAYINNFDFEKPKQAFWIVDERHGVTISAPVFVEAVDEGWRR